MDDPISLTVERSSCLSEAVDRFLEAIGAWSERVQQAYPEGLPPKGHDSGTFMTPWAPYIKATGDKQALTFMLNYRDEARRYFEGNDEWLDGYWRRQEVHHGTEHFDILLRELWHMQPDSQETVRQMADAAEHIGNWKPGVPAWFDWETGLFRSLHLGTEFVGDSSPNFPDSVRMARLSLLAYDMTGQERYLTLAKKHGENWARALVDSEALPLGINLDGPIFSFGDEEAVYRSFAGAAPNDLSTSLPRAENLLASGVPDFLLDLWQKTGEHQFRAAAEQIIDTAVNVLDNPIAWQAQAAVRRYREVTNGDRYDGRVREVSQGDLKRVDKLTIVPEVETTCVTAPLGMRPDKPDWLDQDGNPAPSPLLIALYGMVTDDEAMLTEVVDLGFAHFRLAESAFGDVTHHGCGSRSLSAVCRGHGRLNGAGVVTEVLDPAIEYLGYSKQDEK